MVSAGSARRTIDTGTMSDYLLPEEIISHAAWMRSLARGLVIDDDQAEDLVQEAFTAVAERQPPRPRSVRGWLRGMVRNLARHGRRDETRRRRREELAARPESCPPSHAEVLERAELQRAVVDCLLDLPEPYRGTLLSRYFSDMQVDGIAARDGVPPATVRTRLKRGLERLRRALDARHGGDRDIWRAVLLPLATAGFATGAAGAAAPAQSVAAAAALPGAATGAAPSTAANLFFLGGALLAQKTIAVAAAATLLSFAVGLGLGLYSERMTPEVAKRRFQLVEAAKVNDLEARLKTAAQRAAAEASKARGEAAALAARLEALEADLKTARAEAAPAAEPKPAAGLPVAFGEFADLQALKDADWPALASALKRMNELSIESIEKLERGEPIDQELTAKIAGELAALTKFTLDLFGKIPTHAPFNGEFTHPLIISNLMGAMLEAAGVPLSAAQSAAIARLGSDYERQYAEKQASYSGATPAPFLRKLLDEFELKHACVQEFRSQLTPEQREELIPPRIQDRVQSDLLSAGAAAFFLAQSKGYPSAGAAREHFQRSTVESLGLTGEQAAALQPAFDAWYEEVKPLLVPQKPTHLSPPLDAVLQAGRAYESLLARVLELPDLDANARKWLLEQRQWTLPQVFEKEP